MAAGRSGKRRRKGFPTAALLGLWFVLAVGFLGYYVFTSQSGTETESAVANQSTTEDTMRSESSSESSTDSTIEAAEPAAAGDTVTQSEATVVSVAPDEQQPVVETATEPTVRGVLSADQVVLEGEVSDQQVAESLVELLTPLAGNGNVVNDLVIEPTAGLVEGISISVADEVVFALGSDTVSPQFFPTLDQMVALMQLNPNITVVVEGHTDTAGDEVQNLALSQRRADAVVDYIAANSINRFRLEPRGRGSGEPIDDNATETGRQRNRRIEFDVEGFELST